MLETVIRVYEGYATPKQMLVIGFVYNAMVAILGIFDDGAFFSDFAALMIFLDFSLGFVVFMGAWRSFKRYDEDALRWPMMLFIILGGSAISAIKYL